MPAARAHIEQQQRNEQFRLNTRQKCLLPVILNTNRGHHQPHKLSPVFQLFPAAASSFQVKCLFWISNICSSCGSLSVSYGVRWGELSNINNFTLFQFNLCPIHVDGRGLRVRVVAGFMLSCWLREERVRLTCGFVSLMCANASSSGRDF